MAVNDPSLALSGSTIINSPDGSGSPSSLIPNSARYYAAKASRKLSAGTAVGGLVFPLDNPKYRFKINLSRFNGYTGLGGTPGSINSTGSGTIILPLPSELLDRQDIKYTEYAFGSLGGALGAVVGPSANRIANNLGNTTIQSLGGEVVAAGKELANNAGAVAAGAAAQIAQNSARPVVAGIEAFAGVAINQFFTILLEGPTYKQYHYTWDLLPRDERESRTIRDIIRRLRIAASPDLTGGNLLWKFPEIAQCEFMPHGNGKNTFMYRFKPAVIESLAVDFAPGGGGAGFYKGIDNAPEGVRISIAFKEIEYWLRRDWE